MMLLDGVLAFGDDDRCVAVLTWNKNKRNVYIVSGIAVRVNHFILLKFKTFIRR